MRKPASIKLFFGAGALLVIIASVVAFGYLFPAKQSLKLSGEVQAREIRNASRFGGRVSHIYVQEGQTVKPGDLLIAFDDSDLQAKLADAKATLSQALAQEQLLAKGADMGQIRTAGAGVKQAQEQLKMLREGARPDDVKQVQSKVSAAAAQHEQALQALTSGKTMLDEGIISQQKYDALAQTEQSAKSAMDGAKAALNMSKSGGRPEERQIAQSQLSAAQAQYSQLLKGAKPEDMSIASANVEKARAALQALQAQLSEVRIKAPSPGYVSVLAVTQGELVAPGRPVITLIDYAHLWTDVYVPESRLLSMSLTPGQAVEVKARASKTQQFAGKVALINPKSEFIPNSGGDSSTEESTFRVKINIDGTEQASGKALLYPGMKVDVYFNK